MLTALKFLVASVVDCFISHVLECRKKMRKHFIDLLGQCGWVCEECRCTTRSAIQILRAEVSYLTENIAELQTQIAELKSCQVQESVWPTVAAATHSASVQQELSSGPISSGRNVLSDIDVHHALNDIDKQKKNVIVSGLTEDHNRNDAVTFQELSEEYVRCKPMVVSCIRLGQPGQQHAPDKPQQLLVRLRNEEAATNLLQSSQLLRATENPAVARNIYINPDLTPAAAKLAFQEREKKRQRKAAHQQSRSNNSATCQTNCHTVDQPTASTKVINPITHGANHQSLGEVQPQLIPADNTSHSEPSSSSSSMCNNYINITLHYIF